MNASWIRSVSLYLAAIGVVIWAGETSRTYWETGCLAQESTVANRGDLAEAVRAIRRGGAGMREGFEFIEKMRLRGACPDQLLALIHCKGEEAEEIVARLGWLIAGRDLKMTGKQLTAEYDKAGPTGRRARQAVCAFAAYQAGRGSAAGPHLGGSPALPEPKKLDEETLTLLKRALGEDDPAVRVAAADSIRLAGIRDDRFLEPLLAAIGDENTVVSDAASLAAVDLGFERAGALILRRLEKHLQDPKKDSEGDLAECGLPLAPIDAMHLWGEFYSPRYDGGGWVVALGMLRYPPAVEILRKMAAPYKPVKEDAPYLQYLSGGENQSGSAVDLAKAMLDIENRPHRPAALLDLAEDSTLAGDVRAAALRMLGGSDSFAARCGAEWDRPRDTSSLDKYYEPRILERVVALAEDQSPISDRGGDPSRLSRLAIEVAANMFDPHSTYYQARPGAAEEFHFGAPGPFDENPPPIDPAAVYPKDLLPVRRDFQKKLESLLNGKDGALALEVLAVGCPEWGTSGKYVAIATDSKRRPELRAAAANLLGRQPVFIEMQGGGFRHGTNVPPETAKRLLPLLEVRAKLEDWRQQEAVVDVFRDLLGYPGGRLTERQRVVRKELLPKFRAMRGGPQEEAALCILLEVYGFSRPSKAWNAGNRVPAPRLDPPNEMGSGLRVGPPAEVTARSSFGLRDGVALLALTQRGKTLLVGDGSTLGDGGCHILLVDPRDFCEKAKTSISEGLPWASSRAVVAPDEEHVLVFNRYIELSTLKTVCVLDVKKAVREGNVHPQPLGISPNGKSALVQVGSYLSSDLDALALFDLASGGVERIIDTSDVQSVSNACFLNDEEIAVQGSRDCLLAVNLKNGKQRDLCDNGPSGLFAGNWHMVALAKGRYLVVSGSEEFVVIETSQAKEVFRKRMLGGNAVPVLGGAFLLYQGVMCPETASPRAVFFCARVRDGKIVAAFGREKSYATLMPGEKDNIVYGVESGALCRLRFEWEGILRDSGCTLPPAHVSE